MSELLDQVQELAKQKQRELERKRKLAEQEARAKQSNKRYFEEFLESYLREIDGKHGFKVYWEPSNIPPVIRKGRDPVAWGFYVQWAVWEDPNIDHPITMEGYTIEWASKDPIYGKNVEHVSRWMGDFQRTLANVLADWMVT